MMFVMFTQLCRLIQLDFAGLNRQPNFLINFVFVVLKARSHVISSQSGRGLAQRSTHLTPSPFVVGILVNDPFLGIASLSNKTTLTLHSTPFIFAYLAVSEVDSVGWLLLQSGRGDWRPLTRHATLITHLALTHSLSVITHTLLLNLSFSASLLRSESFNHVLIIFLNLDVLNADPKGNSFSTS